MVRACIRQCFSEGFTVSVIVRAAVLLLLVSLASGCGGEGSADEDLGEAGAGGVDGVRMVVLSPALADTLRVLGYEDQIVGRHRFDVHTQGVPAVGDNLSIDYEVLASLRPDVLVLEASETTPPERLQSLVERIGTRVHRLPNLTLDDVRATIGVLDGLARGGADGLSEAAADLVSSFDSAFERLDPGVAGELGGVLLMLDGGSVLGRGSFHHDILLRLGVDALPRDGGAFVRVTPEDVAALAPDVIVLLGDSSDERSDAELLGVVSELSVPAVEAGAIVRVEHAKSLLPSVSLVEVAELLREGLVGVGRLE